MKAHAPSDLKATHSKVLSRASTRRTSDVSDDTTRDCKSYSFHRDV